MSSSKHAVYNLFGALLPIPISLATIPMYIGLIGDGRYGVLAIAWLLLDYFGLFDAGLGRATSQRIASLSDASQAERATTFWTAISINLCIGLIGGLIAWPVASYFFGHAFLIEDSLRSEMVTAIPWLILAVPMTTLSSVLTGSLQGRQRFLELNIISALSSVLIQVAPLVIANLYGPDLERLLFAAIASKTVSLTILFVLCRKHVFKQEARVVSSAEARRLLKFGGWVTVTALVSPLMTMLDRIFISASLGARFVSYYTVPFQLVQRSAIIPAALTSAIFPRLSFENEQEAKRLSFVAFRSLAVLMTPLMLFGLLLMEAFICWWLNPEFAQHAALLSKILLFGFWINAFAYIPFVLLLASGRPGVVAKCHLAEIIPYMLGLYFGLYYWGLPGAAAAYTLRAMADFFILTYFTNNLKQYLISLRMPLILMMTSLVAAIVIPTSSVLWSIVIIGLVTASFVWSFRNIPYEMRILFSTFLRP